MAVTNDPQHSIYEQVIEDDAIVGLLDNRENLRQASREASKTFRQADAAAKERLEKLDLGVGAPVRIGNYVVTVKPTAGRSVQFETAPGQRLQISLIDD